MIALAAISMYFELPGGKCDYIINGNMIAGFGLVAFPAQIAAKMKAYNPDSTWEPVRGAE